MQPLRRKEWASLLVCSALCASVAVAKDLSAALQERLEEDVHLFERAVKTKDTKAIWEAATRSTQEKLPYDTFLENISMPALREIDQVSLSRVVDYSIYGGVASQPLEEAYFIVELDFVKKTRHYTEQSVWVFSVKEGHWHFHGFPFGFVFAPFSVKYPGVPDTSATRSRRAVPVSPTEENRANRVAGGS